MRLGALVLCLGFAALGPDSARGDTPEVLSLSVDQIPALIQEHNLHARAAQLSARAADAERGYLGRSYLPRLDSSLGYEGFRYGQSGSEYEPVHRTELSFNLYNGGRDTLRDQIREREAGAATADATQTLLLEVTKARRAYWNLIASRELHRAIGAALVVNKTNQNAAVERISAGLATEADRLEFEIHEVNLQQDLARAELAALNNEHELKVLLGVSDRVTLVLPDTIPHVHEEELLTRSFDAEAYSAIQSLRMKEERIGHELQLAERGWRPSVDLGASYALYPSREREFEDISDRDEIVVSAAVSFQLLDKQERHTEIASRSLQRSAMRAEREQSSRELAVGVQNAQRALRVTHDLIHKAEQSDKKASEYLRKVLDGYQKGVNDSPDVLQAAEKALEYTVRLIELRRDYQLARTDLMQSFEIITE